MQAVEKGFHEAVLSGVLMGCAAKNIRAEDGASNAVDSSELAVRIAAARAFRQTTTAGKPVLSEAVMEVHHMSRGIPRKRAWKYQ
mmetsp:Transcript_20780/g.70736  ORF Transcript_20780/g.70736 Transcript_20780/m.70736 type:complete len:85 (-) Transcript_20780:1311-1565(-)